jgi:hypothetical protein
MSCNQKAPICEIIGRDAQGRSLYLGELAVDCYYVRLVGSVLYWIRRNSDGSETLLRPVYAAANDNNKAPDHEVSGTNSPLDEQSGLMTRQEAAFAVFDQLVLDGVLPKPVQGSDFWRAEAIREAVADFKRHGSK